MARYHKMPIDQDWNNVWPTASMFKQCTVPFAVRQGYVKNSSENDGLPPEKYGNTELMKIPNFLHLTPPQIKKHCQALKSKKWQSFKRLFTKLTNKLFCNKRVLHRISQRTQVWQRPSVLFARGALSNLLSGRDHHVDVHLRWTEHSWR